AGLHHPHRRRRAPADGQRGHGQDHPGALPEVHQPHGLRPEPLLHPALPRRRGREPGLRAEPAGLPQGRGADRLRELRLRLVPRARALGAARLRHPLRHRARLRRHLPQQLLQERHPAGPPAARGVRNADGRRPPRRQRPPHGGPGAASGGAPERRGDPLRRGPAAQAPAAERPGRHRPNAPARRRHRLLRDAAQGGAALAGGL
ncbi:MAG: 3-isopropylmalate dehydratase small subunit, partial [uncultured Acetobacteraceae bacterium]